MSDYIPREAALESVREKVLICESLPNTIAKRAALLTLESMNDPLESIPAADVRPIIRGHWITEEEAEAKGNYLLRDACSVCGHCDWDNTESKYFNYCPNCGARMEES